MYVGGLSIVIVINSRLSYIGVKYLQFWRRLDRIIYSPLFQPCLLDNDAETGDILNRAEMVVVIELSHGLRLSLLQEAAV